MGFGARRCDVSPFCSPAHETISALGLAPDLPWRWLHLGPIGPKSLRAVEHCGHGRERREQMAKAIGAIGRFAGYRLDLLGMTTPPPGIAASWNPTARLWFVHGVAWRRADEVRVEWRAERDGPGALTIVRAAGVARPDALVIAGRCEDLLTGRLVRPGRPPLDEYAAWRNHELAVRAEEIKAEHPRLPWRVIAGGLGISERALRNYRADARRGVPAETRRMA